MDFSQLVGLGRVAGIGGLGLGVVVLLLKPVIEQSPTLSEPARGWLLLTVAIGAFAIGALGLIVWRLGSRSGAQVAQSLGDDAQAHNIDHTKGSSGRQDARTRGSRSPAINERRR
jgi:hypothetical protein